MSTLQEMLQTEILAAFLIHKRTSGPSAATALAHRNPGPTTASTPCADKDIDSSDASVTRYACCRRRIAVASENSGRLAQRLRREVDAEQRFPVSSPTACAATPGRAASNSAFASVRSSSPSAVRCSISASRRRQRPQRRQSRGQRDRMAVEWCRCACSPCRRARRPAGPSDRPALPNAWPIGKPQGPMILPNVVRSGRIPHCSCSPPLKPHPELATTSSINQQQVEYLPVPQICRIWRGAG